ncbi:MAG TPA: SAM-dependent methyltransferase [Woeseiaceae bacterium]|nr:SAM-dependent methyltransferase [Woeseiaceae bacterium]
MLTSAAELPLPDPDSLAHSERVAAFIRKSIREAGGSISFAEFMQHALYAPGLGYYSAGAAKLGAGGDFITAPESSTLFAKVLARQCAPIFRTLASRDVLELGAGSGALAADLLKCFPELTRYRILEVSADLRQRQENLLRQQAPEHLGKVEWLDTLPRSFSGIVIANEVADALPVERFERAGDGLLQHRVVAKGEAFAWRRDPAPLFLEHAVGHLEHSLGSEFPVGYVSELSPGLPGWIADISASLDHGFMFLFDYGLTRAEYYASDRGDGWLRCHFRHRAHNDPLIYPGIQDLSAWVDFTTVAEGATGAGMEIAGFVSQAHFLMNGGLEEELAEFQRLPTAAQLELSRQVKMLTLPTEMGEHFKCIGLSKGCDCTPASFSSFDRTHSL